MVPARRTAGGGAAGGGAPRVRSARLRHSQSRAAGTGGALGWQTRKTADGVAYYHNTASGELSWDMPSELMNEQDRGTYR